MLEISRVPYFRFMQKLGGLLRESGSCKVGRLVDEVGKSSGLLRKFGSWELGEPVSGS
jgi:hypothetical protein